MIGAIASPILLLSLLALGSSQNSNFENYDLGPESEKGSNQQHTKLYGSWNVTQNNITCIMIKAQIQLKVNYTTNNGPRIAMVNLTSKAKVMQSMSNCVSPNSSQLTTQSITWKFPVALNSSVNWYLTFTFSNSSKYTGKNNNDYWVLSQVHTWGNISGYPFINNNHHVSNEYSNGTIGDLGMNGHSILCKTGYTAPVGAHITLLLSCLQVQAFTNSKTFKTEYVCTSDLPKVDLIPIIVGGCLAGLVLIVTVAYIIKTARSKPSVIPASTNGIKNEELTGGPVNGSTAINNGEQNGRY